jgi:hypothetical protein
MEHECHLFLYLFDLVSKMTKLLSRLINLIDSGSVALRVGLENAAADKAHKWFFFQVLF